MALLNFKKDSLFRRGSFQEAGQSGKEEQGGVLAVWGSPGSGKSILAVKLAKYLAQRKKNVALLMCDMTAPMIPCICPPAELECERSLGSILAAPCVSSQIVKYNIMTHRRFPYLALLGVLKGENEYTYPAYTQTQAKELLESLRQVAPYVIIDCSSYIANDILSAVGLMEADDVLRLYCCDLKSVSYFSSQLPLLKSNSRDANGQYRIVSNVKPYQAQEEAMQLMGGAAFRLCYTQELERQYLSGSLLDDLHLKESMSYRREMEKIAKEVFGC